MTSPHDRIQELLSLLEGVAPSVVEELRHELNERGEELYNSGYRAGAKEGELRAKVPDAETFQRGEAKGMTWAYHAATGSPMGPHENPYVNPILVEKLLKLNRR